MRWKISFGIIKQNVRKWNNQNLKESLESKEKTLRKKKHFNMKNAKRYQKQIFSKEMVILKFKKEM